MATTTKEAPARAAVTKPSDREIRIERTFNASRDRVWRAYTEPELVAQWWGRGNKLVVEKMEVKRGGHWRYVEHANGEIHGFEGRYREVTPPERLVSTFEWDGMPGYTILNTTEFKELGDGRTNVITTSLFYKTEERDGFLQSGMEGGMNESYAALDRLLERTR